MATLVEYVFRELSHFGRAVDGDGKSEGKLLVSTLHFGDSIDLAQQLSEQTAWCKPGTSMFIEARHWYQHLICVPYVSDKKVSKVETTKYL